MNYYLNLFPFGPMQSKFLLPEGERFDQDNFPDEVTDVTTLLESLKKHSQALQVCEDQLMPFLRRDPFVPDYFGFEHKVVETIDESGMVTPQVMYVGRDAVLCPVIESPGAWVLMNLYGEKMVDLFIPNAMIGYFVMASLGYISYEKVQDSGTSDTDNTSGGE